MQHLREWYQTVVVVAKSKLFGRIVAILIIQAIALTYAIGVYLSGILAESYTENLHTAQLQRLSQLSDSVELSFSLIERNMSQFLWESDVISAAVNPTRTDTSRDTRIINRLQNEVRGNELVKDAHLYIQYNGMVYSADSNIVSVDNCDISSVMQQYLNTYLSERPISDIDTRSSVAFIDGGLFIFDDLYLQRRYCTVVYQIDLVHFRRLLGRSSGEIGGIEIFDDENQAVFASLYDYQCGSAELEHSELFMHSSQETGEYYITISDESGWKYVLPVSNSTRLSVGAEFVSSLLALMGFVLIASVLCALYIAAKIYQPVGELVDSIVEVTRQQELADCISPKMEERDQLQLLFHQAFSEYGQLRDMIRQYSNSLVERILWDIIDGNDMTSEDMTVLAELIGSNNGNECCQMLLGRFCGSENNLYIVTICSRIRMLEVDSCKIVPMYWNKEEVMIAVFTCEGVSEEKIEECGQYIRQTVDDDLKDIPCTVFWGTGGIYRGIQSLRTSYQEARENLNYRQYYGKKQFPAAESTNSEKELLNIERIRLLWNDNPEKDRKESQILLHELLQDIYDSDMDRAQKVKAYRELIDNMSEKLISMQVRSEEIDEMRGDLNLLDLSACDNDLHTCATHIAENALSMLYLYGRKAKYSYVDEAKAYIAAHYTESSLAQSDVSKHIGITSSYLSTQFRKVTGQSFMSYLNLYRVEKAKQMLAITDLPVQQIGYLCGFISSQSFIRVFKKYTQETPGQYRNHRK